MHGRCEEETGETNWASRAGNDRCEGRIVGQQGTLGKGQEGVGLQFAPSRPEDKQNPARRLQLLLPFLPLPYSRREDLRAASAEGQMSLLPISKRARHLRCPRGEHGDAYLRGEHRHCQPPSPRGPRQLLALLQQKALTPFLVLRNERRPSVELHQHPNRGKMRMSGRRRRPQGFPPPPLLPLRLACRPFAPSPRRVR